jgi:hypothetical protein
MKAIYVACMAIFLLGSSAPRDKKSQFSFNELNGGSTYQDVIKKFATARTERFRPCKITEQVIFFADGPSRCDYIKVDDYSLAGYKFDVSFFFFPSKKLKTISLNWPTIRAKEEPPTGVQVQNAYLVVVELFTPKYGAAVSDPVCNYLGGKCTEWQLDGSTKWHAGGERIEIKYDDSSRCCSGVSITYRFLDPGEIGKF